MAGAMLRERGTVIVSNNKVKLRVTGMQLGIFEGKGLIYEKGHIKIFQKKIQPVNIVFQIY